MITLIDINKAIVQQIKNSIVDTEFANVPILAEDVSEPIIRPSIKIQFDESSCGKFNANNTERNLTARIYYFAADRNKYKIENLKMQDLIENALIDGLQVDESFFVYVEDVNSSVVDTVLISSFDLYMIEERIIEDGEPIENLEFTNQI